MQSPIPKAAGSAHSRTNSLADIGVTSLVRSSSKSVSSPSGRQGSPGAGTFAPKFIKSELDGTTERVGGIEGENDFSGKRYVWVKDSKTAFVKGEVIEELGNDMLRVQCDDGSVS